MLPFKNNLLAILFSCLVIYTNGQEKLKYCGTTKATEKLKAEHPEYFLNSSNKQPKTVTLLPQGQVYIIPIVFHILHNYGGENISDAQVKDAVRILNEDFRKKNADTSDIVSPFNSIAADCEIEFRLPTKDPNGNCTNGIDRIATIETYIGDESSKLNQWPRDKYLNIWVVNSISSGAAGYAYFPSSVDQWPQGDGIVILSTYIGSIGSGTYKTGRALTHEIGHYLSLPHTWGGTNEPGVSANCNDDDGIGDTPNTIGWTTCNLNGASCGSPKDNVQNYMEYAYCDRMFTQGQKQVMINTLTSSISERNNLWSTQNLLATGCDNASQNAPPTCKPIADFGANKFTVCEGSPINFFDQSWNGTPSNWEWTFTGGTPNSSANASEIVTYNLAGTYTIKLKASNTAGTDSIIKTAYVNVISNTAKFNNPQYYESFESGITDWELLNKENDNETWSITNAAAYTGTKSIRMSFQSPTTFVDELISSGINLTSINKPSFSFRLAHALANSTNNDKLEVLVSTDCGNTWQTRYFKSGSNLATTAINTGVFTPTSSDWRKESISLTTSITAKSNVFFKFKYTSGGGNHLYIDDINIESTVGIDQTTNTLFVSEIFPNPSHGNEINIRLNSESNSLITIHIYDLLGNKSTAPIQKQINSGENTIQIQPKILPGIYFLEISDEKNTLSKKIIVQ